MNQGITSSVETRVKTLLGSGVSAEQAASALGITPARISQLLADESFATEVTELKYKNLVRNNERDETLDNLEDKLIHKVEQLLPLIMRPMEAIKALQTVNGAKRRGQSAPASLTNQQTVVQINMPTQIVNQFVKNINNQVVQAGDQQLLTIQSGSLLKQIQAEHPQIVEQINQSKGVVHDAATIERAGRSQASNPEEFAAGTQQEEGRSIAARGFIQARSQSV